MVPKSVIFDTFSSLFMSIITLFGTIINIYEVLFKNNPLFYLKISPKKEFRLPFGIQNPYICLFLFCYFFSETSGNLTRRAINKMALASMFLINSAISIFKKGITPFSAILLLAIFFCFLGDFILLFSFLLFKDFSLKG